ncbi:RNB domain-containing ribonuclease [Synechococcus sp. HK01-R]|nr:RNB domain-containing ribonuclease [Synechococcus sp. HK01-R]
MQGSKVRLSVGFGGKEQVVPARQIQILHPLPSGASAPPRLGVSPWQFDEQSLANHRPMRREWGETWVLLHESGETLELNEFAGLVCAEDGAAQRAACWLALQSDQDLFRLKQEGVVARSLSDVRMRRRERQHQKLIERREERWRQLLKLAQPVELATLDPTHQNWIAAIKELASGKRSLDSLDPDLQGSLRRLRLGEDRGDLRHLLAALGQWDRHQLMSMDGTSWCQGFSQTLQEEAQHLLVKHAQQLPGDAERLDLTHQRCVTIDDDDTRDIDDGLALERRSDGRLRIWIHVADPGRLVAPDSPLDLEARRRGSSLYLARGILPMFPEILSTGPFSLLAGQRNAAWSTWVELDDSGEIEAYSIERSWVSPRYRLSYEDADELIDLAPPEEADLAELNDLLERRREWRVRHGALLMDLPEGRIRCRNDEQPSVEITEPSPSRLMVAEAMILAGAVAARFGVEHDLALPFRSQLPADLPSPAQLDELPDGAVRFAAIKRCLSRGLMGTAAAPHFSLGLSAYAQATSPIRRYGDLVVQRQIEAQLSGEIPLNPDALQELLNSFDSAVREGIAISREDQRHWQQVWFEAHNSEQWQADFLRWLRPQDRLGLVRIEELAMDLAAECPANAEPGEPLLLRVQQVDSLRDQLKLVASTR